MGSTTVPELYKDRDMIGSILGHIFHNLMFFLPIIIGYVFAIYGLTLDNFWLSLAAIVLGILTQIATIVMLPESMLPQND